MIYGDENTECTHNKLYMPVLAKIDAHFILYIILITSVTIISHN